jgi:hypothetical protein
MVQKALFCRGWLVSRITAGMVIPGFSFHKMHDQDFYCLLVRYLFRNGDLLFNKGAVDLSMYALCLLHHSFSMSISKLRCLYPVACIRLDSGVSV